MAIKNIPDSRDNFCILVRKSCFKGRLHTALVIWPLENHCPSILRSTTSERIFGHPLLTNVGRTILG